MVQKFHSIHEIDPEFIPNIELLLQEDMPSFKTLVERHDAAPEGHIFSYFLFFGPTQNTPVGFAQLCLRPVREEFVPLKNKLKFWNKDYQNWKQVTWKIGHGSPGLWVFDPKYARLGKERIQELIKEYENRSEVKAQELFRIKGLQDLKNTSSSENFWRKDLYVLEPFIKVCQTYKDYLDGLSSEMRETIKKSWKELHRHQNIQIGDYMSPLKTPKPLPVPEEQLKTWTNWGAQVLTFENDLKVLGCLLVLTGKNGNIFFEPFPFEPEENFIVKDHLYIQYALLKFFEMPNGRKCHLMKFGSKLLFEEKEDLIFFESQGFRPKIVVREFTSQLRDFKNPL